MAKKKEQRVAEQEDIYSKLANMLEKIQADASQRDVRIQVLEDRLDVYAKMLKAKEEIVADWKPIQREKYPETFQKDENCRWVTVTPLKDGDVVVNTFRVPFKKGVTMGTFSTFADNARARGIIP